MKVVALMGKAGSGKDTLAQAIIQRSPQLFNLIVSCTTRPSREGEKDGVDYYFLTNKEFAEKVKNGDMLEYTEFNNWKYGTAKSCLSSDKINIGVFNPTGIRSLMGSDDIDLTVYYLRVPDRIRLIRQLERESNPDIKEIIRRYYADEGDFKNISDIDFIPLLNSTEVDMNIAIGRILGNIG